MIRNDENNGILGYGNSKRKRVKNALYNPQTAADSFDAFTTEERSDMNASLDEMSSYLDKERERWAAPVDAARREKEYIASARNYIVPKDDEMRRRRQFVMSDRAVKDAADSFFDKNVKGIFESEKHSAGERAMEAYKKGLSVPGSDPVAATGAMRNESDPRRVIRNTMQRIPEQELDDVAGSYARYAGLSPEKYRKAVVEPAIEQRMFDEYVKEAAPKSSGEYIARSAIDNSLTGKLVNLGLEASSPRTSHAAVNAAGLSSYDASRTENLIAGIGSLVVDMPMFAGIGGVSSNLVGKAATGIAKGLSSNLAKKYAAKGMQLPEAERIVRRAIVGKMGTKIAQNSATQGLTLGGYDAGNSIAEDLLYNDGIDVGKAVDAYAHGLATGVAVGAVGTPLKELSRGLTGGKKVAASAGVLGAEAGVFTLSSNADKLMSGVEVEPIDLLYNYGESIATLGAMRMAHWRPTGGSLKLDANGKLKQKLNLTTGEAREIRKAGVDPQRFISALENSFRTSTQKTPKELDAIKSDYLALMESGELSAATRSKLLYLVENKVTSTPPVAVDCNVHSLGENGYSATLLDAAGRRISTRDFSNAKDLETFLIMNRSELRKNKIATCEEALLGKYDSENFFRQAGRYAQEHGTDINEIAEAMYKKAGGEPLDGRESEMMDNISRRASYGDKGVGTMLYNLRKQLEREFNLNEGSLLAAVNRKAYRCSAAENKALDKYLEIMQQEVEVLKNGTTSTRYNSLQKERDASPYGGLGNEEIKALEKERYINFVNSTDAGWLNKNSIPDLTEGDEPGGRTARIKVPTDWNKPYAWSYSGLRNSYEDMMYYKQRAEEIAGKMGHKLNFLFDESEVEHNSSDIEYNNKVRSQGWLDNSTGKVYINLPNIKDVGELERVVVHEVVGHKGLSNLFGEYIFDFYEDLYKMADTEMREGIHEIGRKYNTQGFIAVEEYLAHLAEKSNPTRKERTVLNRLKDCVNNALVRMNIISGEKAKVTTDELCNLLSAHHKAMLDRVHPNDYRASVFGKFPSARHKDGYYDTPSFHNEIRRRAANNELYAGTPEYLLPDKKILYDEFDNAAGNGNHPASSYRFIGERGADNLAEADNGRLNEQSYLATAREMEANGASSQEIWAETGWARGADGMWRSEMEYETIQLNDVVYNQLLMKNPKLAGRYDRVVNKPISERTIDDEVFIKSVFDNNPSLFKDLQVRDVVSDPLFYAAYPELAYIPVKVTKYMKESSYYDPKKQVMYVNRDFLTNPQMLSKTIVTPLQQMIQHYEGFEKSVSLLRADAEDVFVNKYYEAMDAINKINSIDNAKKMPSLLTILNDHFIKEYGMLPDKFLKAFPSVDEYILYKVTGRPQSFSGNVETRNLLTRQTMLGEDRMFTPPEATEDVPRNKQISLEQFSNMDKMLTGPMDVIYRNVRENNTNRPMKLRKTSKKMDELQFTPLEKKILGAQYDEMSATIAEAYDKLKKSGKLRGKNALDLTAALVEKLAGSFIEEVALGGIYKPNNLLNKYSGKYGTVGYKRGRLTDSDYVAELLKAAVRKEKERNEAPVSYKDNGMGEISEKEKAARKNLIDKLEQQHNEETENFWKSYYNRRRIDEDKPRKIGYYEKLNQRDYTVPIDEDEVIYDEDGKPIVTMKKDEMNN
ncbi:MAG: hypothetical protein IJZ22_07885 [Bacteroidaceae bacterium]|nr:hypothetical protein [Bacteroidaceae bacterium]